MTIGIFISLTTNCATQPFVTNTDILAQDGDYQRLSQQYPDFAKREHRFKLGNVWQLVEAPLPCMPNEAVKKKKPGCVALLFVIEENGLVGFHKVIDAEPSNLFNESALKTIQRYRYQPAENAEPTSVLTLQLIKFSFGGRDLKVDKYCDQF